MYKRDAVRHFGGVTQLARALGVSYQAVYLWPERVPEGRAYQLQLMTRGRLRVDPSLYMSDHGERIPSSEFTRKLIPRGSFDKKNA